jgi:hypothetical protein
MTDNFTLNQILKDKKPEEVIKALQVNLGYSESEHLPTIDQFIEDDYYLGKLRVTLEENDVLVQGWITKLILLSYK